MEKYIVIDNDSKEAVTFPTNKETADFLAAEMNAECHECGGSSTQYGIAEAEAE